ncbi:hypothetical protein [Nocardioides sp.]|uniref:hypothetical protein n=1 Tax=Nocardioides sp. TaxID=35761 RepID=UPI00273533EB|nr:hypothetical protein [Nocardioides sp.]MDP3891689.1 hypothetical protein [Nocardioides sp.]
MSPRVIASLLGLAGGAAWVVGFLLERGGTARDEVSVQALSWTGLCLLAVAAFAAGVALVRTAPVWLRLIVGLGVPLLVWAVVETVRQSAGDAVTEGIVGVLVFGLSLLTLARAGARPRSRDASGRPGRRASSHRRH